MGNLLNSIREYLGQWTLPSNIQWNDIVEILLIAFFVYQFMLWIRNTRAYSLLKGIGFYLYSIYFGNEYNFMACL